MGNKILLMAMMMVLVIVVGTALDLMPTGGRRDRVVLYLHGGGYVLLSARSHAKLAAGIGAAVGCRVVSLDYRLAPEHPFPAALDDAIGAYRWLLSEGYAPEHIALAGDSASATCSSSVGAVPSVISATTSAWMAAVRAATSAPASVRLRRFTRPSTGSGRRLIQPRDSSSPSKPLMWLLAVKQRAASACWLSPGWRRRLTRISCSEVFTPTAASRAAISSLHR
mgnify:CR=1 FL=1